MAPGSLVLSRTAIFLTLEGMALMKCSTEKGRKRWTFRTPTFWPEAASLLTVSSTVSAPEPITMTMFSASGAPAYSKSL